MASCLLDVNVLIALSWSHHIHHHAAHRWFASHRRRGWATCPLTEAGFLRVSMQPAAIGRVVLFSEALHALRLNVETPGHEFWACDFSLAQLDPEVQQLVRGARQVTDAILLDLAIRRRGRLATLDQRISDLLPPGVSERGAIDLIPVD